MLFHLEILASKPSLGVCRKESTLTSLAGAHTVITVFSHMRAGGVCGRAGALPRTSVKRLGGRKSLLVSFPLPFRLLVPGLRRLLEPPN